MVPIILVVATVAGIVVSRFLGPIAAAGTVTAALFGMMLLGKPRMLVFVYFGWATIMNMPVGFFQYTDEILVVLLYAFLVMETITGKRGRSAETRGFRRMVLGLRGVAFLSAVVNRPAPLAIVNYALSYLAFVPVFLLTQRHFSPADSRRAVWVLAVVFGLQLVLNLGWPFGVNPLPNDSIHSVDFAKGSLNGCNMVAYFDVFCILLLVPLLRTCRGFGRGLTVVGLAIATYALYISFTNHAYILPLIGVGIQVVLMLRRIRGAIVASVVGAITLVMLVYLDTSVVKTDQLDYLTPDRIAHRWELMIDGPKGQIYGRAFTADSSSELAYKWFLGYGPGNGVSSTGIMWRATLAYEYLTDMWLTFSGRRELTGGSITQQTAVGLISLFSETGIGGVLLLLGLHLLAVFRVLKNYRRGLYTDTFSSALAEAFVPSMLIYVAMQVVVDLLYIDFISVGLWIVAGILWNPRRPPAAGSSGPADTADARAAPPAARNGFART